MLFCKLVGLLESLTLNTFWSSRIPISTVFICQTAECPALFSVHQNKLFIIFFNERYVKCVACLDRFITIQTVTVIILIRKIMTMYSTLAMLCEIYEEIKLLIKYYSNGGTLKDFPYINKGLFMPEQPCCIRFILL